MTGLQDRVAFVTGAGENLGRAVALKLAGAGANVAVNVRENEVHAAAVVEEVRALGVDAVAVVGDVADNAADAAMVAEATDRLGPVDVLVHCVGMRTRTHVVDVPAEEWRRVMDVNCTSFLYLAQLVLPSMVQRGYGRLVAITGADIDRSTPGHGAVAASKVALTSLAKTIAVEHGTHGITANLVSPTISETTAAEYRSPERLQELLAIPRAGTLDEIAAACLYLASADAAYITGQTLRIDGGFTL